MVAALKNPRGNVFIHKMFTNTRQILEGLLHAINLISADGIRGANKYCFHQYIYIAHVSIVNYHLTADSAS